MKKLKLMLTTLSILFALSGVFAPLQIVRAEEGGPQGTTDSQRKKYSLHRRPKQQRCWAAIMRLSVGKRNSSF